MSPGKDALQSTLGVVCEWAIPELASCIKLKVMTSRDEIKLKVMTSRHAPRMKDTRWPQ